MKTVREYLALICIVSVTFAYSAPMYAADSSGVPTLKTRGNAAQASNTQAQNSNPASQSGQKLSYGAQESIEGPPNDKHYEIRSAYFQVKIPGITNLDQITQDQKDAVVKSAAIFNSLNPGEESQKADQDRFQQLMDQAPDFEHQVEAMKTWIAEEEQKGFNGSEESLENVLFTEPEYFAPDPGDPNWFNPDGSPKKLIHSSDWGKAKVDATFSGRQGLIERASKIENGQRVVDDNSKLMRRIATAADERIPEGHKIQIHDRIAMAIANPGDHRYVGESIVLPAAPDGRIYITDNFYPGGVVHNEVYDPRNDPKGQPPVKGVPIRTDAYVGANGVHYPAKTYFIAEICTNPTIILQRISTVEVKTQHRTLKYPSFKNPNPRTAPPTSGEPHDTGKGLIGGNPGGNFGPPELTCFAFNKEHPDQPVKMSDLKAGSDFIFDMMGGWRFVAGSLKYQKNGKGKEKGHDIQMVGMDDNATAMAYEVPEGDYIADFTALNIQTNRTVPCLGKLRVRKEGSNHFWAGFILGAVAGAGAVILICWAAGGCFCGHDMVPPGEAPKTANNGGNGLPPGQVGSRKRK